MFQVWGKRTLSHAKWPGERVVTARRDGVGWKQSGRRVVESFWRSLGQLRVREGRDMGRVASQGFR